MRSFLTMLGIIIGIASIIAIVSTIKGTSEQIKEELLGSGKNTVDVNLNDGDSEYDPSFSDSSRKTPILTEDIKDRVRELENVNDATFFYSRSVGNEIYYLNTGLSGGQIYGVDSHYLSTCGYVLQIGRGFVRKDFENYRKVALLDKDAAATLFGNDHSIGKTIEIAGEPFTVVGIYTDSRPYIPPINTIDDYNNYYENRVGTVLVPVACWPIICRFDEPPNVVIQAVNADAMSDAGHDAEKILNEAIPDKESNLKYKAVDILEQVKKQQEFSEHTNRQLVWIASIALLVGGIGVMNIMLVSVTERTSEIGLKKAIGARKRKIMMQFLTEAAVLTSLGGILGVAAGIGLSQAISRIAGIPVAVSVPAVIGSVFFSMLIGIIFGFLPSVKAANLNPIDALRRE
ncbi:MAG: ABC transporter permease [Eubacteriales bacterium]|nr:ABC transporter permease [Eubacteriales bacterium]